VLTDKPLLIDDILADENEAGRMALIINTINGFISDNREGSLSIAISGDWGSGKTTYLNPTS